MGTNRDLFYICLSGNNLSINFLIIEKTGNWGFIFCLLLLELILAFLFKKLCDCPKITQPEFEHQSSDNCYNENFIFLKWAASDLLSPNDTTEIHVGKFVETSFQQPDYFAVRLRRIFWLIFISILAFLLPAI